MSIALLKHTGPKGRNCVIDFNLDTSWVKVFLPCTEGKLCNMAMCIPYMYCITGGECIPTADQVPCGQWCPRLLVNSFPRCLWKRVLTSCTKLYSIPGTLGWPDATGHSSHPSNIWQQMVSLTHWGQGIITSVEQWLFYTYFDHKWGVVMCCCAIYNDKSKSSDKKKPANKLGICSG